VPARRLAGNAKRVGVRFQQRLRSFGEHPLVGEARGVGLIGGYFVAFHPVLGGPRGASGLWLMQATALCLASGLLLGFYLWILRQRDLSPALR